MYFLYFERGFMLSYQLPANSGRSKYN